MHTLKKDLPVVVKLGFKKLIATYQKKIENQRNPVAKAYMKNMLEQAATFPKLEEGIETKEDLAANREIIDLLMNDLFPQVLSQNEIKAAGVPFSGLLFKKTDRLAQILKEAGTDFKLKLKNLNPDVQYMYACVLILEKYYGYSVDFSRPMIFDIPDDNGFLKHYRLTINGDFLEMSPTEKTVEITPKDVDLLIQNSGNMDLWREKFPPHSWVFSGFLILSLSDVTTDYEISALKTELLKKNTQKGSNLADFSEIFQSIYKIHDLHLGLTLFNTEKENLVRMKNKGVDSYVLNEGTSFDCRKILCDEPYMALIKNQNYFSIANVEEYARKTNNNLLSQNLLSRNIKSCILAPIAKNDEILGILELVSSRKNELNSINAIKLDDILPYIVTTIERNKSEYENQVKAVIQNECTGIHPSVLWRFEEEARHFIDEMNADGVTSFRDIAFDQVYPLYGQIDIVGSSKERNLSIQKDLANQLEAVSKIIQTVRQNEELPIYEQLIYRIETSAKEIEDDLKATSEQKVMYFLKMEIDPILEHVEQVSDKLKKMVSKYRELLDTESGLIYKERKIYDTSVENVNRSMARYLDRKQLEAQKIFPHYFERYKTDGVDHNMYIGQSMAQHKTFNIIYLYNLRLWQLQTMCEMENKFYQMQENAELHLDAASLILVFNSTLSIRYRMDEKKFDIDGTYNARYEIIKKRIDKANIKNTDERVTQKGKIAIIYAQKSDEKEYLRYIKYLQAKKYVGENVELLELEDVQGVIGLKAIRIEVLYHLKDMTLEETLTYENLIKELN